MKQRIKLSILMLWSFMHLLLFAFNGFPFFGEFTYSLRDVFYPFNGDANNLHLWNALNFPIKYYINILEIESYDFTEFIVYVITPILLLGLYNYIRHNQFRLIVK